MSHYRWRGPLETKGSRFVWLGTKKPQAGSLHNSPPGTSSMPKALARVPHALAPFAVAMSSGSGSMSFPRPGGGGGGGRLVCPAALARGATHMLGKHQGQRPEIDTRSPLCHVLLSRSGANERPKAPTGRQLLLGENSASAFPSFV